MSPAKLRVAVLMGGPSSEYEISLATGKKILAALDPGKYFAQPVVVTKERTWLIPPVGTTLPDNRGVEASVQPGLIRANSGIVGGPEHPALQPREEEQALRTMQSNAVDVVFIHRIRCARERPRYG